MCHRWHDSCNTHTHTHTHTHTSTNHPLDGPRSARTQFQGLRYLSYFSPTSFARSACAVLLSLCLCAPALASNRALLIGVGDYLNNDDWDLYGIDHDIVMMQDVARNLGFKANEITTLEDAQATRDGIVRELRRLSSVAEDDQVLVYFSGHGTQVKDVNGDEEDGQDEVLAPHDLGVANGTWTNGILDDDVADLLADIKSRHVLILIDACHSGTATKSLSNLGETGTSKYLPPPRATKDIRRGGATPRNLAVVERRTHSHVVLSAAMDNQLAVPTKKGSVFTLGVSHIVGKAAAGRELTPTRLAKGVETFIKEELDEMGREVHRPQLMGDDRRLNANIFFAKPAVGPMRARLDGLVAQMTPMTASAASDTYRVGQNVTMTFDVPAAGYLNVVNVNANDNAVVLFPNKHHSDNRVERGKVTLPTSAMEFDITVGEPRGDNITYAFLTERPLDFYKSAVEGRSANGTVEALVVSLSTSGYMQTRNLVVEARTGSASYAGKLVLNVQ